MCKQCYLKISYKNCIPFKHKTNNYDLSGDFGIGYASNTNNAFYFDLDDYDKIKQICWYETDKGYLSGRLSKRHIFLHRLIMNVDDGMVIDHIDRNPKNCRKSNLRICTQAENTKNRNIYRNNKSGVTGVWFDAKSKKWIAYIQNNKKNKVIGYFTDKEDAISARLKAEREIFGEFSPNSI